MLTAERKGFAIGAQQAVITRRVTIITNEINSTKWDSALDDVLLATEQEKILGCGKRGQ